MASVTTSRNDYQIGIITALPIERAAVTVMLDEEYDKPDDFHQSVHDPNRYTWGRIGLHKVVITSLAAGVYGNTMATTTAMPLLYSFPEVKFGLMVGIGAGIPSTHDIRLGDVVVSQPSGGSGGVFQYDLGKAKHNEWDRKDFLARPPDILLKALSMLQTNHELAIPQAHEYLRDAITKYEYWGQSYSRPITDDYLFPSSYIHCDESIGGTCSACDPSKAIPRRQRPSHPEFKIYYGIIGSGNSLIKDAGLRDWITSMERECICLEMEAAGLMNNFPCLVIRGICDYADSHKNDSWQRYACATAAAFSKELLSFVPLIDSRIAAKATEVLQSVNSQSSVRFNPIADLSVADSCNQVTTISPSDQNYHSGSVSIPTETTKTTETTEITKMHKTAGVPFLNKKNVNARSGEKNDTLLHSAIREADLETVKLLVGHGADMEARNKGSATPLYIAAQECHLDIVKYLIEQKANIEAAEVDGRTPLFIAAENGHLDVVKYLIERKANIEAADTYGATPLYIASQNGHLDVVKYLIEQKANIKAAQCNGWTPLLMASYNGHLDVVKYLIERKANIEAADTYGATPLYIASQNGHLDAVKYLIEQKANIEAANTNGATPLFIAAENGHLDVVKYLIKQKANIEAALTSGATPLYTASMNGHLEVTRFLLDNGANIRAKGADGTAAKAAGIQKHEEIVKLLQAYSDKPGVKKKNRFMSFFD